MRDDVIRSGARPSTRRKRDNMIGPDIRERFELISDAYDGDLDFHKIPEKDRSWENPLLCGVRKVAQMLKDPSKFEMHGEAGGVYFNNLDEFCPFADDDIIYLLRCGVVVKQGALYISTGGEGD